MGLTDEDLKQQYDYTKKIVSENGIQKGVTWQATPGLFAYRRSIAKDVYKRQEYAHFLGKEEEVTFDAGFMWQETKRELKEQKIEAAVRIFAPLGVPAELMLSLIHI